jgi:dCMP deaminase
VRFSSLTEADRFYLAEAFEERLHTDDPKAKTVLQSAVGAVIANANGEIARSSNVLPPRLKAKMLEEKQDISTEDRYHVIEHAERAALFKAYLAGKNLQNATLYCTRFPCSDCARAIAWSPIRRVVLPNGFAGEKRWLEAQRAALRILRGSGIKVRYLPAENQEQS